MTKSGVAFFLCFMGSRCALYKLQFDDMLHDCASFGKLTCLIELGHLYFLSKLMLNILVSHSLQNLIRENINFFTVF